MAMTAELQPRNENHREAESLTVISHGRIQPFSSNHQRPSTRRTPGLDEPRDLQRRNCLQESSESTGNGEEREASLASGTGELGGGLGGRGDGVGTSARGLRSSSACRVRSCRGAGNGTVGGRVGGSRGSNRGRGVAGGGNADRVGEGQSGLLGAGVGVGVAGADGDLSGARALNSGGRVLDGAGGSGVRGDGDRSAVGRGLDSRAGVVGRGSNLVPGSGLALIVMCIQVGILTEEQQPQRRRKQRWRRTSF